MNFLLQLEGNILLFIQEHIRQDWMTPFWIFITSLGNKGWFWLAVSALMLIPRRTRKIGIMALLALSIGFLITNLALKNLVARIRPYETVEGLKLLIARQSDFSFPSGHACASFAAASVYFRKLPQKWGISAVVLAALIAFSRLYVGVHYPTDVLAGAVIGIWAAWAAIHLVEYIERNSYRSS
ncbi:phosphatase PAP2 family protein [Muricomes intestini]|uniref:Undecaprenyl-diphosphatase n=1 Tax=Muricomes intestini TaxID=1796634 RepID=A0A4R3KC78_9FIRM|nr:phosphatase PAP2 family protein [Muricomes intestini]TCS80655.1 undecaprenyl-diphosphatase [Muricomes intestini]HAX50839.1 phosphatase PAP2 family protein [Lachnospiraceae bacterium]